MKNSMFFAALIMLISTFASSISQVLLKKASQKTYKTTIREYLNPLVIFAYFIFFITTLVNVVVYKVLPLSMGPILEASGYIYITIFGIAIFKEKMNYKKIIALCLIVLGIVIYSLFGI